MCTVGVIYENYLKGRKRALWISVSNDLKYDAERDLADIGNTGIEVRDQKTTRLYYQYGPTGYDCTDQKAIRPY